MILVTGGTGFLGGHLLFHLLKDDQKVIAIKRSTSQFDLVKKIFAYYSNDPEKYFRLIEWVDVDLLNYAEVHNSLESITKIYHAAAMVSYDPKDRKLLFENNVIGTRNLVNAAIQSHVEKFCYVSSISALGETSDGRLIDEITYWSEEDGNSGYSFSKYYAELEVWRGIKEGLDAFVINPSVILGYGDWDKGSCALFSTIFKGFSYYTMGSSGFVDVKDVCKIMIDLVKKNVSGESFIISAENIIYKDIFKLIAKSMQVKAPKKYATPFLTSLAWRSEYLRSKLLGKKPLITKESANTSHKKLCYSDEKLQKLMPNNYSSIETLIDELGEIYLKEIGQQ